MRRPGFVGTAGAVAALLLGAAGCAGDPEPRFAPPSGEASPSVAESASASVSESAAPERLSREETVRAWVEARNAALQDGDTSGMSALIAADCEGCLPFEENISSVYRAGGYFDTEGWVVLDTFDSKGGAFDLRVRTSEGTTVNSEGEDPVSYSTERRELRFGLREVGGQWLISSIAVFTGR